MVKVLRRSGQRLSDHDIAAQVPRVGHIAFVAVGPVYQLTLYGAGDDGRRAPLIPVLYNARVASWQGDRMLWEGEEREHDDPRRRTLKQEWSILLAVPKPEYVPPPTRRLG